MYIQKEFDAVIECRPSFEQLSHDRIINELNRNIGVLKALECIVSERMLGLHSFCNHLVKTQPSFELFDNSSGSLKIALDSLLGYTEQVNCVL